MRIACLEVMECLLSHQRERFFYPVYAASPTHPLMVGSVPDECIVPISLRRRTRTFINDAAVIRQSDLTEQLDRHAIDAFVPAYRSSVRLERWADAAELLLLSPRARLQRRLENKVTFDRILKSADLPSPASFVIADAADAEHVPWYPFVLQSARSEGGAGTHVIHDVGALRALLASRRAPYPMLARELIAGHAFGATLLIGEGQTIISAVRAQCFDFEQKHEGLLGIQWLPTRHFSQRLREHIERTLSRLAVVLRGLGFRGAASIDFMVDKDRALLLECNPRFSAATPQLSLEPELMHGYDFMDEYLRALTGQPLRAHVPALPESTYNGCCADFSAWIVPQLRAAQLRRVGGMPRVGIYDCAGDALRFVGQDIAQLHGHARLLFHYSTAAGSRIGAKSDLGSLIAGFPLFDLHQGGPRIGRSGRAVLHALGRQISRRKTPSGYPADELPWPPLTRWERRPPLRAHG